MVRQSSIVNKIILIGAILILLGSTTVTSINISTSPEEVMEDEQPVEIENKGIDNDKSSPIDPNDPNTCGYQELEILASYYGHVRKEDGTFDSDDYDKYDNVGHIRVGHNKKPIGEDRHYKGFIEFDLEELRVIWDKVDYLVGAELIFYTSDNGGDNFVSVKTIDLDIFFIDLQPSKTGAKELYKDMFDDIAPYKTIRASQEFKEKSFSFNENYIEKNMNYLKDWFAVGFRCATDIDEGKSGGVTIFGSTNKAKLIIKYEKEPQPTDKNNVIIIEGGVGDGLQSTFRKCAEYAKSVFFNQGYDSSNLKLISYNGGSNTKDTIKNSITGWLKERSTSNSDLFIYLIDHGSDGGYFWIARGMNIRPNELDSWLDQVTYRTLTVVMDSCFSGDFTKQLRKGENRIIITSTDGNSVAYGSANGYSLFSKPFFDSLRTGASYGEAFENADRKVDTLRNWAQHGIVGLQVWWEQNPKIDDSDLCNNYGNILPNTLPDRTLAKNTYPVPH